MRPIATACAETVEEYRTCNDSQRSRHFIELAAVSRFLRSSDKLSAFPTRIVRSSRFWSFQNRNLLSASLPAQVMESSLMGSPDMLRSGVMKKLQLAMSHNRSLYGHTVSDGRALFAAIDEDGSESISPEELRTAMQRLDLGLSDKELGRIAEHIDKNGNGLIELNEFLAATGLPDTADDLDDGDNRAGSKSSSPAERAVRARQQDLLQMQMRAADAAPPSPVTNLNGEAHVVGSPDMLRSGVMKKLQLAMSHNRSLYGHTVSDGRALFAAIDEDGSESISPEELRTAMQRLDLGLSDKELGRIAEHIDKNGNGLIELNEFLAATGLPDTADDLDDGDNRAGSKSSSPAERAVRARQQELRLQREQWERVAMQQEVAAANAETQREVKRVAAALSRTTGLLQAAVSVRGGRSLFGHVVTDIPSLFAAIDQDDSGCITRAELSTALKRLGCLNEADVGCIFETIDADGSGRVEMSEFLDAMHAVGGVDCRHRNSAAAERVRKEQARVRHDQRAAARKVDSGQPLHTLDENEQRAMFKRIDTNCNGIISLAELDKAIKSQWPHLDHKPALIRAFKCADLNRDGFITGDAEFGKLE
eukprot:COSAG02_NODE_428_length_22489_cov_4.690219_10_plen_593_part_00